MSSGHVIKDQSPFDTTKFHFSRENQILFTIADICKTMIIVTTIATGSVGNIDCGNASAIYYFVKFYFVI